MKGWLLLFLCLFYETSHSTATTSRTYTEGHKLKLKEITTHTACPAPNPTRQVSSILCVGLVCPFHNNHFAVIESVTALKAKLAGQLDVTHLRAQQREPVDTDGMPPLFDRCETHIHLSLAILDSNHRIFHQSFARAQTYWSTNRYGLMSLSGLRVV